MKILGYDYTLTIDGSTDVIGAHGRLHADRQFIQIANDLHEQMCASTVLHEIIEALNYHLELGMSHNAIMALESSLYQTLTEGGIDLSPLTGELFDGK